jgi:hypothetical protein
MICDGSADTMQICSLSGPNMEVTLVNGSKNQPALMGKLERIINIGEIFHNQSACSKMEA